MITLIHELLSRIYYDIPSARERSHLVYLTQPGNDAGALTKAGYCASCLRAVARNEPDALLTIPYVVGIGLQMGWFSPKQAIRALKLVR